MALCRCYLYLLIILSLWGANVWAINIAGLNISAFRIVSSLLPISIILCFINKHKTYIGKSSFSYKLFFIIWFLYGFISLLWVRSYKFWLISEYSLFVGVACIIAFDTLFTNMLHIKLCLRLFYAVTTLHSIIGWFEVLLGKYYFIPLAMAETYAINRYPSSALGNTNDFATCMLIGFFLSYGAFYTCKSNVCRFLILLNALSMMILIYYASSRANIVALFIGMVFLFFTHKDKISCIVKWLLLIICITIIGLARPALYHPITGMVSNIIIMQDTGDSISVRKNLILNGFIFLKESFFIGVGAGNSNYYMEAANNCGDYYPTRGIINMHNWWMEILVDYGVIIFVMYIVMYFRLIWDNIRIYKLSSKSIIDRYYALSFAAFLVAYIIGSISASSNMTREYVWLFFALMITFVRIKSYKCKKFCDKYYPLGKS